MSEKMKLGEICNFINGRAFKPSEWDKKGLPIVRIQNLNDENAEFNFCSKAIEDKYIIEDNQLLFSWSGTPGTSFGAFFWNRGKAVLNQHIFKVIPKININIEFLRYLLNGNLDIIISKSHGGVGLQHITKRELEEIIVDIPDDKRQEYVAKTLNGITKIINTRKEQLKQFDEIIKSQFVEMFGDPIENPKNYKIVKLSDIADYWNGLTYKPTDVNKKGTIVLRSSNIQNSQLDYQDIVRVNCNIKEKQYVEDNDILMCSRNGSARLVGKVAVIKDIKEKMTFGAFMMIIRSEYYPYLFSYFQTDAFRNQIKSGATTTINQITGNMLNKIKLPLPDKEDINQFAEIVRQIDKQKFEIENSLKEMQELYESLMERYFG